MKVELSDLNEVSYNYEKKVNEVKEETTSLAIIFDKKLNAVLLGAGYQKVIIPLNDLDILINTLPVFRGLLIGTSAQQIANAAGHLMKQQQQRQQVQTVKLPEEPKATLQAFEKEEMEDLPFKEEEK